MMTEDLQKKLYQAFMERYEDQISDHCNSLEIIPGWAELIFSLAEMVRAHNAADDCPFPVKITEIKQKYGALRFSCDQYSAAIMDAAEQAEDDSSSICGYCGKSGKLRTSGMARSTCRICEELQPWSSTGKDSEYNEQRMSARIKAHVIPFLK